MKAFKTWQKKRAMKTVGYFSTLGAYKAGEEVGWKAALKWVLSTETYVGSVAENIEEELEN